MKVWQLRSYFNSLPISFDDMEVVYESGIDIFDGMKILSSVDFLETYTTDEDEKCVLLHSGYIEYDEDIERLAKLN